MNITANDSKPTSAMAESLTLQDQVVAISGAASGLGFALAKYVLSLGARVSLTDVQEEGLKAAVELLSPNLGAPSGRIFSTVTDVRFSQQVDAWISATVAHFGRLDCAANMAGVVGANIGSHGVADLSDEEWAFVTGINLNGTFYATRAQIRAMRENPGGPGGSIVNVSSIAGLQGAAFNSSYSASKHGVIGLSASAAREVARQGIRVNIISPGVVNTNMVNGLPKMLETHVTKQVENQPMGRLGDAEEIARTAVFLLSNQSSYITGAVLRADGGELA